MPAFSTLTIVLGTLACLLSMLGPPTANPPSATPRSADPVFASGGALRYPAAYRRWPYLTSGLDMSYDRVRTMRDHHMFGNVFVNPAAYDAFSATGRWPDNTVLVLEFRTAQTRGSINEHGFFQTDPMGIEVHVRDTARFPRGWGFFAFDSGAQTSAMIPATAACYACHSAHGAVDTTFVQFYPTLLPIAAHRRTLSTGYRTDERQ